MILNTLGPQKTDSFNAAVKWSKEKNIKIRLHKSFEEIFNNIDLFEDEYLIIPVGFENRLTNKNWVFYHFSYINRLTIVDVFILPTKEMVLLENENIATFNAIIHSSTEAFLSMESELRIDYIDYADSKCLAYEKFLEKKHRYCIISIDVYQNNSFGKILKKLSPSMIWVVYKIGIGGN